MKLTNGVIALVSVCSGLAYAGEKVDKSLDAAADGYVQFENVNGQVEFISWDKNEVRVSGELDDRMEKFIFERSGKQILIKIKLKESRGWGWHNDSKGDDLQVYLPATNHLEVDSVNTDFTLSGLRNGVDIDVVNGDIRADDLSGKIQIETVNGDVKSRQLKGNVKLESVNGDLDDDGSVGERLVVDTVNGDIKVNADYQEVKIESVNGDGELYLERVKDLSASTVNGDFQMRFRLDTDGRIAAESVGGDLTLSFQDDVSARFDVDSHGGRIINKLTDDRTEEAKYGPAKWLRFTSGSGEGRVKVTTVGGKITLQHR